MPGGRDRVNMTLSLSLIVIVTAAASVLGQRQPQRPQQPRGCVVDNIDMCRYESHREMVDRFMRIQSNFPHIAKVQSVMWLLAYKIFEY